VNRGSQQFRKLARRRLRRADPLFGVLSDPTKFEGSGVSMIFASGDAHVEVAPHFA
jgi:hypothetical protein